MNGYSFRLAAAGDEDAVKAFMRKHWDTRHPLVELPDFFEYYYRAPGGGLRFALAEAGGALAAIAGYIPASGGPGADVWVSIWVADPAARGAGLELMEALPRLCGCRTLACNNIRPETRPFYHFLGFETGRVGHYYRLSGQGGYRIARPAHQNSAPPPVKGDAALCPLETEQALAASGFVPPADANPYKDMGYIARRYYHFPRQAYQLYAVMLPQEKRPAALLATRLAPALGSAALRIVDYIGPAAVLPRTGPAIDALMAELKAEYADIYCAGLPEEVLCGAGFVPRLPGDENIIPTYLDPPLIENVEYYYFTSRPQGFVLCRADGDQDRPNTPL